MFLHDGVGDGQAEAGALAHFLCRKERIEHPALPLLGNPRAIVIHLEHGGAAFGIVRRPHDDGPPAVGANTCLLGIDQEIEQHLLDLVTVGKHFRQPTRERLDHLNVADLLLVGPQRERLAYHLVQIHHGTRGLALARERQQVADNAGGAFGFGQDDFQSLSRLVVDVAFGEPFGPRQDGRQRVVQLVGNAGNGLAERGHLLGLQQLVTAIARLVVQFLALADVADEGFNVKCCRGIRQP